MNYYCGDVMVRGAYPYYAKRMLDELGVKLNFIESIKQLNEGGEENGDGKNKKGSNEDSNAEQGN